MRKKNSLGNEVKEHESYGVLLVSRTANSGGLTLFGSSIKHSNTIRLTISRAEEHRSQLHYDTYMGKEQLIDIEMSPAQFAEAITSFGIGFGVPCTIRRFDNKRVEDPPYESKRDQFSSEFEVQIKDLVTKMVELEKTAKDLIDQKTPLKRDEKDQLKEAIFEMTRIARDRIPFFSRMFNEMMDKTVHAAKMEFESHVQSRATELGLDNLHEEHQLKLGEEPKEPAK